MPDDDPLTPGELRRAIARLEAEDRAHADRLTALAAEMLPVKLWDAEHRALGDQLRRHERESAERVGRLERLVDSYRVTCDKRVEDVEGDIDELRRDRDRRSELTWQKIVGLVAALAAVATVIVTLIGQTKGIK